MQTRGLEFSVFSKMYQQVYGSVFGALGFTGFSRQGLAFRVKDFTEQSELIGFNSGTAAKMFLVTMAPLLHGHF